MPVLTEAMKSLVERQRLGFVATVGADGAPNLSPKGTLSVWDDDTLVFADIASPNTVRNLLENPACEINVVDPLLRKGYRFKGRARILLSGPTFDRLLEFYHQRGVQNPVHHMVLVRVEWVAPIASPVYALGRTEDEVRQRWVEYWKGVEAGEGADVPGV